jgi:hypothetical protein
MRKILIAAGIAASACVCSHARAGYQVQVEASSGGLYEYNGPQVGSFTSSGPGTSASGTTDSTGTLTNVTGDAGNASADPLNPAIVTTGTTHVQTNLANSTVLVSEFDTGQANNAFIGNGGNANGQLNDTLHFTVAGATAGTMTPIKVTWVQSGHMQGSGSDAPQGPNSGFGPLGSLQGGLIFGSLQANQTIALDYGQNNDTAPYISQTGGDTAGFSNLSGNLVVWSDTLMITGPTADVAVEMYEQLSGKAGTDTAYTGDITLSLPQGVTFTSDSGVFLTQTPEPGSLALIGLAASGLLIRRRTLRSRE